MLRTRGHLLLVACLALWIGPPGKYPLWGTEGEPAPTEKAPRTDPRGDPLPEGALTRLGTLRLRHASPVSQLAFTAQGRTLASLGRDNAFSLWQAGSGKELSRLELSGESPTDPDLSELRLRWMLLRGRRPGGRFAYPDGNFAAGATVFAADGKTLAVREGINVIQLHDPVSGKRLQRFEIPKVIFAGLALSADGKILAGSDHQGVVHVWNVATGKQLRQLKVPGESFFGLVFSPDAALLAGVNSTGARLWDVASGKKLRKYEEEERGSNGFTAIAFSPNGKRLVTASGQAIHLWEVDSEEELIKIPLETPALALAFAPDGKTLASGGEDNRVRLWDLARGKELRQFSGHHSSILALAFAPDGKTLASGSVNGQIRLWATATGKELAPVKSPGKVTSISFLPGGQAVALGSSLGNIHHWDPIRGKWLHRHAGPPAVPAAPAETNTVFAPDGKTIALVDDKGLIRLWDAERGKERRRLEGHQGYIGSLVFSPDSLTLASSSADGTLRLWSVVTGRELYPPIHPSPNDEDEDLPARMRSPAAGELAFSADGRTLAAVTGTGRIRLWETASGKERANFQGTQGGLGTFVFSPDGKLLASGGSDEVVRLWDPAAGKVLRGFVGHQGKVNALAFSPSGKWLASGGDDKTVRVWDVASGKELRRFPGHRGAVLALRFSPDGKVLVSGSADTTALVWDVLTPPRARPPAAADALAEKLEKFWADLGSDHGGAAYAAVTGLADLPDGVVPFLEKRLKPVKAVPASRMAQLINDLESKRYPTRQKAIKELEQLDGQAAAALRLALIGNPSAEATRSIQTLLKKLDQPNLSREHLREVRAIEVLERIGNAEARRLLTALARGAMAAELSREAAAALARLTQRLAAKS
jgi:WD40 repeat protein